MEKIIVKNICNTALTQQDGLILQKAIKELFTDHKKIILDFTGMTKFVTLFFNNSIGYFILNYSPEVYDELISIENLNDLGNAVYKFSYDNAVSIYKEKLSTEKIKAIEEIAEDNITNL